MRKEIDIYDISDKELKKVIKNSKQAEKEMYRKMNKSLKKDNKEIKKNARKIDKAMHIYE